MVNFEYLVPTKMVFGKGTEEEAGRLIKEFGGHKALIHWGGDYVRTTGLLERIERGLAAEGIEYVERSRTPLPPSRSSAPARPSPRACSRTRLFPSRSTAARVPSPSSTPMRTRAKA